jgi:thiamine transport system substrate-binding protein
MKHFLAVVVLPVIALSGIAGGCGSSDSSSGAPAALTLVAYDSFPPEKTTLNAAIDEFTKTTGIAVKIVIAGDAGTMVTKATLTAGNPEGDVMWGVDNTLLSAALDGKVFDKYEPNDWNAIATDLTALVPGHELTPVDFGDVCVNYDIGWFTTHSVDPPGSLDDLLKPEYKDLLVVENPATSSTGLAFLLATIAHGGGGGWQDYWKALRTNGVKVVDGWTTAYQEEFSGAAGSTGERPLVVSYGSSPPAEVIYADPPRTDAPTAVIESTCFRQVEFTGVLRGTKHETEARKLVDFLISPTFQNELPLNLFVYPARVDATLPVEFTKFAVVPATTLTIDPADIAANREQWQDEWTTIVLR